MVQIDTVGYHFQNNERYNNFNYGVGINYEVIDRISIGARTFRNSYKDGSTRKGEPVDLYSQSISIDYRFWNNALWATHVGWTLANHYANGNGIATKNMQDMPYVNICRKLSDATSQWQGCGQVNTYKNGTNGWDQYASFKLQYTF
jgi:hypothetical protein